MLYGVGVEDLPAPVGAVLQPPAQVVEVVAVAMVRRNVTTLLIENVTVVLAQRRKLTN